MITTSLTDWERGVTWSDETWHISPAYRSDDNLQPRERANSFYSAGKLRFPWLYEYVVKSTIVFQFPINDLRSSCIPIHGRLKSCNKHSVTPRHHQNLRFTKFKTLDIFQPNVPVCTTVWKTRPSQDRSVSSICTFSPSVLRFLENYTNFSQLVSN